MPVVRIPIGRREFAPSWFMTVLTLVGCVLFVSLGRWQWERGQAREAEWQAFERGARRALPLGTRSLDELERFQRVTVRGTYDTEHQFLLDNRTHDGRAGYEVLTPLTLEDGRVLLVNRGWVPFTGYRERLPDVSLDASAPLDVTGRVAELPSAGIARGRVAPAVEAPWPKLASFPGMEQLSHALGRELEPRILLLDAGEPHGYVREWLPPGPQPETHFSYAIQWWCFAALALILWLTLSTRKVSEDSASK